MPYGLLVLAVLLGILWGIAVVVRRWVASFQVQGGPRMAPPRPLQPTGAIGLRGQVILLGPRRMGPDSPTGSSAAGMRALIRARRFTDASRAVDPADTPTLTALAVARHGPLPDLMLAARRGQRREQTRAKGVFAELFPGVDWGHADGNSFYFRDAVAAIPLAIRIHAMRGKVRAAGRTARRYVRVFPNADDAHRARLDGAMFDVLAGRAEAARAVASGLANTEVDDELRSTASRVSQGVAGVLRTRGALEPCRARRPDFTARKIARVAKKMDRAWPEAPHDVADIAAFRGRDVADLELDEQSAARALREGHEVWVGIVDHFGECRAVNVIAVEARVGVALLSQGQVLEWSALEAASVWGARMLVVHRRGQEPFGSTRSTVFTELPFPRAEDGRIDGGPGALDLLAGAVRTHANDAAASFIYALALERARLSGGNAVYSGPAHQRHLAVSAVRFPGARWPRELLAALPDAEPVATDLLATGLRGDDYNVTRWNGMARFDPRHADEHLRQALTRSVLDGPALLSSAMRAAARRNGQLVDAHIEVLARALGENDDVIYLRQVREVVWRGPDGASMQVPAARNDTDGRIVRLSLAAQSGNRNSLQFQLGLASSGLHDRAMRDAPVVLVAHQGEYRPLVDAVVAAAHPDGLGGVLARILVNATEVLTPADDHALAADLEPLVRAGDVGVGEVVAGLESSRPALALQIARLQAAAPGDRLGAAAAIVRMELSHASDAWGDGPGDAGRRDAVAAASRARDALAAVRASVPMIPGWQGIDAVAWLYEDPERARAALASTEDVPASLAVLVAASAVERALGNAELAEAYVARAANPDLVTDGLAVAVLLGLRREVDAVFSSIDPDAAGNASWAWYGRGGSLPKLPEVPRYGETAVGPQALWRLAEEARWPVLLEAVQQRWRPSDLVAFDDGADRVALESLAKTGLGESELLSGWLRHTRHPAMLKAAWIARSHGLETGDAIDLDSAAPGLARVASKGRA